MSHDSAPGVGDYLVGIMTADITPPIGSPLCGYAARGVHASTGAYHPLRCVAVVIDDGSTPVLFLSAEWLGFYDRADQVRVAIGSATGISPNHIVVSGTHTHCGPALRASDIKNHGWIDEEYLRSAESAMVRVAERAWRHRFPAQLRYGITQCSIAMNRRRPDPAAPGRVLPEPIPYPAGIVDHDVTVIAINSLRDGVLRGVLFSYACHPTSRSGLLIGGDYVSFAYDYVGEAFPYAQPAFLQGCAGDQKPRPIRPDAEQFPQRTVDQVSELGHELGRAVEHAVSNGPLHQIGGQTDVRQAVVALETEPVYEPALCVASTDESDRVRQRARSQLDRIELGLDLQRQVPFEIQTIAFGNSLAVIAMAGEMNVEHGLRLKRDLADQFDCVLPLGYANGIVGYVPVRRQFAELGYEVVGANQLHGRTGRYLEDTEERVHSKIKDMLQ